MSAVLRSESDGDLDLGDPFSLLTAYASISKAVGGDHDEYPELFQVIDATEDEEDCDHEWFEKVRTQAADVLADHSDDLDENAKDLLSYLSEPDDEKGGGEGGKSVEQPVPPPKDDG